MKTKKFSSKLTLTKQTISDLEDRQQDTIRGGITASCPSDCKKCPITYHTYCGTCDSCIHSCTCTG